MENKFNIQEEKRLDDNETVEQENLIKKNTNQDNLVKNSQMNEIKNMFNLNNGNISNESSANHKSLKIFKKKDLSTNSESYHPRNKSNENIKEGQNYRSNKNFPSKANVCKGNINNNTNIYVPIKSSPIFQYYEGYNTSCQEPIENGNNIGYFGSPTSPGFNISPSQIFINNKNIGSGIKNEKQGQIVEPITLNNNNEEKNFFENFGYDQNNFDISYNNDEPEINNKKDEEKNLDGNKNNNNKEEINDIYIEIKGDSSVKKFESSYIKSDKNPTIESAMKKLIRKKSINKVSEDLSSEEKEKEKNRLENKKENIINEQTKNKIDYNNEMLEDFKMKNVLNDLEDEVLIEEKNKIDKKLEDKNPNEIQNTKNNPINNISILNNWGYNNINKKENINNYQMNNISFSNQYNKSNILNYRDKEIQNNPNLINNNYINNNFNNNYNNSYSQFNYMMNNSNYNYPNINLMMMLNNQPNLPNNIYNQLLNTRLNNQNNQNNNIINNNQQLSKIINPYNINQLNNNNLDFQKNNQLLQSTGNINIQNNYFLYNNNINNNSNNNYQEKFNNNNNLINKEEKQKKKKKKKIKKLDSNIYMNKSIKYYLDNFSMIAKDQGASRYLQDILKYYPVEDINLFFAPLSRNILKLINDPFANYLIQKIISYLSQDQLLKILNIITPSFYEISCNSHGTRVLQKLIELIKTPELKSLFYELVKPLVPQLLKDLNGTYIVQKFARLNMNDYGRKINSIIIENSIELCTYRHGCCVIQKYLENRDPNMLPDLIYKLLDGFNTLITDQFGNYVIKTILFIGNPEYSNKIGENISKNINHYSKHKYSSNVVEKCFDYCQGIYLNKLIWNIQKEQNLKELILDEHGNYVVQKVLSISPVKKKREMLIIIKSLFPQLRQTHFGEKIINRICTTYPNIHNL